jgi:hypothetical protein
MPGFKKFQELGFEFLIICFAHVLEGIWNKRALELADEKLRRLDELRLHQMRILKGSKGLFTLEYSVDPWSDSPVQSRLHIMRKDGAPSSSASCMVPECTAPFRFLQRTPVPLLQFEYVFAGGDNLHVRLPRPVSALHHRRGRFHFHLRNPDGTGPFRLDPFRTIWGTMGVRTGRLSGQPRGVSGNGRFR